MTSTENFRTLVPGSATDIRSAMAAETDAEKGRDKKKRELAFEKVKGPCFAWYGKDGCKRGGDCSYVHSCSGCGKEGHGLAKCPKVKAT